MPAALALHDDLRAGVGLRLQQHRVHVHAGRHPRRPRLHGLGAADLAAVDRDGGIVRHVLRLERRNLQAAPHQRAREPRDDRRLAGIGAGGLDHQRGGRPLHQNSMPFWPFTPGAERMLHQRHLGDEIGHLDQFRLGVAAGDDDVLVGGLFLAQESQHFVDVR